MHLYWSNMLSDYFSSFLPLVYIITRTGPNGVQAKALIIDSAEAYLRLIHC